jgi:isocitrate dehydrogenase (NAD+)
MLEYLDDHDTAARIRGAVDHVVRDGSVRTGDMGGSASTKEFTAAIVRALG